MNYDKVQWKWISIICGMVINYDNILQLVILNAFAGNKLDVAQNFLILKW